MKQMFKKAALACILPGLVISNDAIALEMEGKVGVELLNFFQEPSSTQQHNRYSSFSIEPEFYHAIDDNSELKAKLFYRYDAQSTSRTHGDVREFMYYRYADDWEVHAGIGKVFWGVTESRHLIDTINQVDNIESLDDEQRLGQLMLQTKFIKDWGTVDLFILPGFREVDFGQSDLRPTLGLPVISNTRYQDSAEQNHIDFAARWNHTIGDLDLGITYFNGTQRAPLLVAITENSQLKLQPTYVQTQNFGLDAQYIAGDWLLKLEALHRKSHKANGATDFISYDSNAMVAGFEYSFIGVNAAAHDIGLIGEYLYDEWDESTPFQKDWMTAVRWVWNDEQSTEVLFGNIYDLDNGSQIWQLEASRRIGESWKAEVTGRWVNNDALLQTYKENDLLSLKLNYFY
ncbi:MAG: hypothetical protein U9N57_07840 [Pseudomonadota bacterium]|nr:hypothetical protein [Pseudomonadota bacterium]